MYIAEEGQLSALVCICLVAARRSELLRSAVMQFFHVA